MPLYEYRCDPCDHTFETLIRHQGESAHCPHCGGIELTKQFSVPASAQNSAGASSLPIAGGPSFGCGSGPCRSGLCESD